LPSFETPTCGRILRTRLMETVLAAQVLQEQRRTAPTVMSGVNDPVAAGLVPSLAPAKPVYLI
jgi:ABC-type uncharacterized transport system substrate-binding protein